MRSTAAVPTALPTALPTAAPTAVPTAAPTAALPDHQLLWLDFCCYKCLSIGCCSCKHSGMDLCGVHFAQPHPSQEVSRYLPLNPCCLWLPLHPAAMRRGALLVLLLIVVWQHVAMKPLSQSKAVVAVVASVQRHLFTCECCQVELLLCARL